MAKKASKKTKLLPRQKLVPRLTILFGILCLITFMSWKVYQGYVSYITRPPEMGSVKHALYTAAPTQLAVNRLSINVPVIESVIKDGVWGVSDTKVTHLMTSANPGENGTVILYGHNKDNLLKPIINIKQGDTIEILDKKNKVHKYKVSNIITVSPSDTYVLNSTGKEKLVVYTCTGFFNSNDS